MNARVTVLSAGLMLAMSAAGCQVGERTRLQPYIASLSSSADGRYVACLGGGTSSAPRLVLYVYDTLTRRGVRSVTGAFPGGLEFRPQGDLLVALVRVAPHRCRVALVEPATGHANLLASDEPGDALTPVWARSGAGLAYWSEPTDQSGAVLWYYDLGTRISRRIGEWPCALPLPSGFSWTTDQSFVMVSHEYEDARWHLWQGDMHGRRRPLSSIVDPETVSASPNGTRLCVLSKPIPTQGGPVLHARDAWVVNVATGDAAALNGGRPIGYQSPAWLPDGSGFVLSAAGGDPAHRMDFLAIARVATGIIEPLTASDGERILGKLPQVCMVHGRVTIVYLGPENRRVWRFDLVDKRRQLVFTTDILGPGV